MLKAYTIKQVEMKEEKFKTEKNNKNKSKQKTKNMLHALTRSRPREWNI